MVALSFSLPEEYTVNIALLQFLQFPRDSKKITPLPWREMSSKYEFAGCCALSVVVLQVVGCVKGASGNTAILNRAICETVIICTCYCGLYSATVRASICFPYVGSGALLKGLVHESTCVSSRRGTGFR